MDKMTNIPMAITVGGLTGGQLILADALTGDTAIPVKAAFAVFMVSTPFVWWLGRALKKNDDTIRQLRNEVKELYTVVMALPCHSFVPNQCKPGKIAKLKKLVDDLKEETTTI